MTALETLVPPTSISVVDRRGRRLRATWHAEAECFVVSLWRDERCVGTVQLDAASAAEMAAALAPGGTGA
jgi:hypothetical protein